MNKIFKLGEFFCGPGGLGYGASLSKIKDKKKKYFLNQTCLGFGF